MVVGLPAGGFGGERGGTQAPTRPLFGGKGNSSTGHAPILRAVGTRHPVYLRYGAAYETLTDLQLSGPAFGWDLSRSYASNGTGSTTMGNLWLSGAADMYLMQQGSNVSLLVNAGSQRVFTYNTTTSTFISPADSYLVLTADATNKQYILTDKSQNLRYVFNDFTVTNAAVRGKLKEESTLQWHDQGKAGTQYTYTTGGKISQITTPAGQDYSIAFTYSGALITKVEIKDASANVLERAEYTYYQNVTSPSTDLGTTNDLVQVKISQRATADTTSLSIVRYTQYRYSGTTSRLKAVYEHDAIQRIMSSLSLSTPETVLQKADSFGTPNVQAFASRSLEYYTADVATSSINTPFTAGENLNTTYGGNETSENGLVKTETIGGCGSCGTAGSTKKSFFYLDLANTADQNAVVRLVVEDTQDSAGTAISRTVYGFEDKGRQLRKAFIQNPIGSPVYWCESWKLATTGLPYRLAEYRKPSAHTGVTTAANLRAFLNPYNGSSWTNDSSTVNSSDGLIETYGYNTAGMRTDVKVKKGSGGTAYYVSAADYGDSINTTLVTAEYDYPTQTTTRSDGKQTSYSYTFYDTSGHQQIKTKTTTLLTISTTQNGSGVATTMSEYYDNFGRLRWTQDGEGYINYFSYSPVMGMPAYQAVDVDPASPGTEITSGSAGNWDAATVGGASSNQPTRGTLPTVLVLTTKTYYDSQGRQSRTTDRGGANHYTVYANTQTIQFPYWNSGSGQSLLPIQMQTLNTAAQLSDQIAIRASFTSISTSSGAPTGFSTAPSQTDYVAWTHFTYDSTTGWLTYTDRYANIPSSGTGTLSTDFYRTVTQYDTSGRKQYLIEVIRGSASNNRVEQVTQYVYDVLDRMIQVNKGVSGDSAANSHDMGSNYTSYPTLTTVSKTVYDAGTVGDGSITKTRSYFGTGANDYTGINYERTYRGHVRGQEPFYMSGSTETPIGPYTVADVDWRGRTATSALYDTDPTWSSVLTGDGYASYASSASSHRRSLHETLYDDLGRIYQSRQYEISTSSGMGSNYLLRQSYFDRNGRLVAITPAYAAGTEIAYDGAGRPYQRRRVVALQSPLYSSAVFQYSAPIPNPSLSSMSGGDAGVLTLDHQTLDANGNVTEEESFEDNHDDVTSTTVAGINLTNNNDYVRRTGFRWYDGVGRLTTTADYGSGDTATGTGTWKYASIPTRPGTSPTASSNLALVTLYSYNSDSAVLQTVTDPAGTLTKSFYDSLGRKTYVAENWSDFSPPSTGTGDATDKSKDRVTNYVYDGPNRVQQFVALDANADGSLSDNQVTTYLYEDAVDANRETNEIYPDSSDTTSSGTNQIKLLYSVDGSLSQRTDQRGTVTAYSFANNRLPSVESVSTLPSGVDGTVRSIARTYDNLNRLQNVTSYGNVGGTGTIVNDIQYAYNDFGQVINSYQSHSGGVNTSTNLSVQYTYDTTTTSSIFSSQHRLQTVVYPNGRVIYYDYGTPGSSTAAYNALSQVREIWDTSPSGTGLAIYDYNGVVSRVAIASYPQPSFKLDLFQGTSGTYMGLDRFGRTVDQFWKGYGSTADVDRIHYAYDYAGNRTFRDIDSAIYSTNDRDQAYTYDGMRRLSTSQQGTLSGSTISGTPASEEDWTLDGLGNWPNYVQKASGTTTLNQGRSFTAANEISGVSALVGSTWSTPAYDAAGNMTTVPKPTSMTSVYTATYDAWNRLISLADGSTTVATYAYDGLNRRVLKGLYASGSLDHSEHAYFNENWQILEVRKETGGTQNTNPFEQYVWHPSYIDAPVLRDYDATTSGTQTRYYYAFDANYNVTAVTASTGTAAERYHYSPYGSISFLDGGFTFLSGGGSAIANRITFTGRQYDVESGLFYFRNRYLHGMLGAFITRDPIDYLSGTHLYQYVDGSPTFAVDPLGLDKGPLDLGCGYSGRFDIRTAGNNQQVGHMHVFNPHGDEIAQITHGGIYRTSHGGKPMCKPTAIPKGVRSNIRRTLRQQVRAKVRGGISFKGPIIIGLAGVIVLGADPAYAFDPLCPSMMGDAEWHPWDSEALQMEQAINRAMDAMGNDGCDCPPPK